MVKRAKGVVLFLACIVFSTQLYAQNVYDLRKLTEQDWLDMSTEERLTALSQSLKHAGNQTFVGDFGTNYDLYKKWGYEFYEMNDRYENYSFRGFENYNIIEERRKRWSYNDFGDRIAKMQHSGTIWHETYTGDGQFAVEMPNNFINAMATGNVDGVWVAKEQTDDWAVSVIGAGAIRSKFSPLTLSLPNMHGMRMDLQTANSNVAIVNSSLLGSSWSSWTSAYTFRNADDSSRSPWNTSLVRKGGVLLRGGYFRRKLGILTLGATYVNQYGVQGNRDGGDDWYGTVSNYTPTPMVVCVRILDDSPDDGTGGPVVFDAMLKVNGKVRSDIVPRIIKDDISRDRTTAITDKTQLTYIEPTSSLKVGKPDNDYYSVEGVIPKYADFFYLFEYENGQNMSNVDKKFNVGLAKQYYQMLDPSEYPISANGTESIVYWWDIATVREKTNRVEAHITLANDYRVQTSVVYTVQSDGGHDTTGNPVNRYNATYWKTMAQAEGNIKDRSNLRTIKVDFGMQVANITYGFDFDLNYYGFQVKGEYVRNSAHYMFPDDVPGTGFPTDTVSGQAPRTGHKWSQIDDAYYITATKDWDFFGFGAEVFKMGKFYRPYLDYFYAIAGDVGYGVNSMNSRNNQIRFPSIEDNDDDDQYPDTMIEVRTMGQRVLSAEDPDGVFPGNDADNDGLPDNNKNNNSIADYDEPFLMFDSDPDEFIFGNDYNNNNIPDFREDDMKMDTPYDLDRQGYHYYFRLTPARSVNLIFGSFHTHGVGLDNRTNDDYFKLNVDYDVFDVGKMYAEYRHERIKDNIRDQYVQVNTNMKENFLEEGITSTTGRFTRDLFYDELEYRNSKVDRLWLDSVIRAVPSIMFENHVKLERNNQVEGTMYDGIYQPHQNVNTLAMINKLVYTRQFGNWVLSPGVKFRFYKKDREDIPRPNDYYTMRIPLVMMKYIITPDTDLTLGMQGIPGFELDFKDFVQSENDFKQKTYTLQLQNKSVYFGYNIWAATGLRFDQFDYEQYEREIENYKSTTTFVKVLLGW